MTTNQTTASFKHIDVYSESEHIVQTKEHSVVEKEEKKKFMFLEDYYVSDSDKEIFSKSYKHKNGELFRKKMEKMVDIDQWQYVRPDGCMDIDILISRCDSILNGFYSFVM